MKKPMIDTMVREKFDDLYTPIKALAPLDKYINSGKTIWECCDSGNSNITKYFSVKNKVHSTDIKTGFNFLTDTPDFDFDIIITNPPYSLKDLFLDKCYRYGKPFALLLPLTALEGKARGEMYLKHGISVIVLNSRLDFTGKGANWFNTSWFVWQLDNLNNNTLAFESV